MDVEDILYNLFTLLDLVRIEKRRQRISFIALFLLDLFILLEFYLDSDIGWHPIWFRYILISNAYNMYHSYLKVVKTNRYWN